MGQDGIITGSVRGINGINVKKILDTINNISNIVIKYGGHAGAAGLIIRKDNFFHFSQLFEACVKFFFNCFSITKGPTINTEGFLSYYELNDRITEKISILEPFGREFLEPIFCNIAKLTSLKIVGKDMNHAQLLLKIHNKYFRGIWFFATRSFSFKTPLVGSNINVTYKVSNRSFYTKKCLILKIERLEILL